MSEPLRAVLFDAVGTLIRPSPDVHEVYAAAGRRFGSRHDTASIRERFPPAFARFDGHQQTNERHERERWRQIVGEVFDDVGNDIEALFNELWDHFAEPRHWAMFADVLPTWRALRERNVVIGIASNFDRRLAPICQAVEPLSQAQHVFCSSEIGFPKPRPEFYAHICRVLELAPQQILMVGDNPGNDVQAARAAGWQAVLIARDGTTSDESAISKLTEITRRFL